MIDSDWDARPIKRAVLELFSIVMWGRARNARGLLRAGLKQTDKTTGESKESYGKSENDPDATGESARGRL
jgi:hypothetical protein